MKKFEEFNSGNVTEVKSAIVNGKATVIEYCSCGIKNCFKGIIEENDIYSLYDHQSLIIIREGDFIRVCQLKRFYKNKDNYIVIIEKVNSADIFDRLENAGIEDGPIYDSIKAIFDKAQELENQIRESQIKDEEEEASPDDIFDILNGKVKKNKEDDKNGEDELKDIDPLEILDKLIVGSSAFNKIVKDHHNTERKMSERFKNFKNKNGRRPSFEEFINMNPDLTDSEKEMLIKNHNENPNPIPNMQNLLKNIISSIENTKKLR
jgi:Rad3-related DNA helicase